MILDDVGLYTLQVRAALKQTDEPNATRKGREAIVVALLLTPAILGLAISWKGKNT